MASLENSIFRKDALEKYFQKRERDKILRLVSPPMFVFLWILLLFSLGVSVLAWTLQEPITIQGEGVVVQQGAGTGKAEQKIMVVLLLPPDQQEYVKVGQPVRIAITSSNITFNSIIGQVAPGIMSPVAINAMLNAQGVSLAQSLSGPALVAAAPVEPESEAQTYLLGSRCQIRVQIGSRSALSFALSY